MLEALKIKHGDYKLHKPFVISRVFHLLCYEYGNTVDVLKLAATLTERAKEKQRSEIHFFMTIERENWQNLWQNDSSIWL